MLFSVLCKQIDVLKISDISFPSSNPFAAHARTTYHGEISEYTICYRHLIESFNEGHYHVVNIGPWKFAHRIYPAGGGGLNGGRA